MNKKLKYCLTAFKNGLIDQNPTFVQVLGLCPTLATTTSVPNAIGMGLAATFVLTCSNALISLLRKFIPKQVRIAAYIVVIAGFVSIVEMLIKAYLPALDKSLGVFIPLIVVNCIILARAEAFASKNTLLPSVFDGIGTGLGFTLALTIISTVREVLGNGTFCDIPVFGDSYKPIRMLIMPYGAFITLGIIIAAVTKLRSLMPKKAAAAGPDDDENETAEAEDKPVSGEHVPAAVTDESSSDMSEEKPDDSGKSPIDTGVPAEAEPRAAQPRTGEGDEKNGNAETGTGSEGLSVSTSGDGQQSAETSDTSEDTPSSGSGKSKKKRKGGKKNKNNNNENNAVETDGAVKEENKDADADSGNTEESAESPDPAEKPEESAGTPAEADEPKPEEDKKEETSDKEGDK